MRCTRTLRCIAGGIGAVAAGWLAGFAWFVANGLTVADDRATATDAIVVLTGGRLRLESGIDLLEAGAGRKLFVSGVNQHVDRDALLRVLGPLPDSTTCCIVLGHDADDTLGNARETAEWMRQERYRSLLLVTSWYHMPRSRMEFVRAMPQIAIAVHPVIAAPPGHEHWWTEPRMGPLVVREYHKFLAALARPAAARLGLVRFEPDLPDGARTAAGTAPAAPANRPAAR